MTKTEKLMENNVKKPDFLLRRGKEIDHKNWNFPIKNREWNVYF